MSIHHLQTSIDGSPQDCSDAFVKDVLAIAANFVKEKTQEGWTKADFGKALIDMLDEPIVVEPDIQADTSMDFDAYLKKLVDAAHASVNARADAILADIRQNHENVMAMLEEREIELINQYWESTSKAWHEEQAENQRVVASCLRPYTTFDEWWNNLSDEDKNSWYETYHEYQYGSNGGLELEGQTFSYEVMCYLNSVRSIN